MREAVHLVMARVVANRESGVSAMSLGGVDSDYYFDMAEDEDGNKQMQVYAYPNWALGDVITGGPEKTWTEMMTEALPIIQTDIDIWGTIGS